MKKEEKEEKGAEAEKGRGTNQKRLKQKKEERCSTEAERKRGLE